MIKFLQYLNLSVEVLLFLDVLSMYFFDCSPLTIFEVLFSLINNSVIALADFLHRTKGTMGKILYWSMMSSLDILTRQLGEKLKKEWSSICFSFNLSKYILILYFHN